MTILKKIKKQEKSILDNNNINLQKKQLGSSETTRVISYTTDQLIHADYLAGLIDGDGSISISKNSPLSIEITLHQEDVKTLYKLRSLLGFGLVRARVNSKAYRIRFNKKEDVKKIIHLINGKLKSSQKQVQHAVCCKLLNITPLPYDRKGNLNNSLAENGWFSGFFDAEGYFSIRNKYTLTLSVGQKDPALLVLIRDGFGCGNIYYDKSWNGYNYCITDRSGIKKVLQYFSLFPLLTVKNVDRVTFQRLVLFLDRKYHWKSSPHKAKIDRLIQVFRNRKKI